MHCWWMIFGGPFAPSAEGLAHARPYYYSSTLLCFVVLLADKCLLPFYGGCDLTRACLNSRSGVICGDCLPGFIEVGAGDPCLRK